MLAQGDLEQTELEETLRIYHAELHIQNDELRQSQRRIERSQARFAQLFDSQPTPLIVLDQNGIVQSSNRSAQSRFGLSREQFTGRFFVRLVTPEDQAGFVELLDSLGNRTETGLQELVLEIGSESFPALVNLARIPGTSADPHDQSQFDIIAHLVDISALKRKERQVREQSELLSNLSNEAPGLLLQFEASQKGVRQIAYVSQGSQSLLGYSPPQLMAQPELLFARVHEDDRARIEQLFAEQKTGAKEIEYRVQRLAGEGWIWLRLAVHSVERQGTRTWFGYLEDITARRETTRMLITQARRAAMGDMLTGITHQWKQPLNALSLCLTNLEDAIELQELDEDVAREHVSQARDYLAQMSQTVTDFVQFFRPDRAPQAVNVADEANKAIGLMQQAFQKNGVAVSTDRLEADMTVTGQPPELLQVFMVLLQNAVDALTKVNVEKPRIELWSETGADRYRVGISDNAGTLTQDQATSAFEAYVTTKSDGTGIGLYIARLITESTFNGEIRADTSVSGCTCFYLDLPAPPQGDIAAGQDG